MIINNALPIPIADFEQGSALPGHNRSDEPTSDFAAVFLLIFATPREAIVGEPGQFEHVFDLGSEADPAKILAKQPPGVENRESQTLSGLLTESFEGQERQDFARTTHSLPSISESSILSHSDLRDAKVTVPVEFSAQREQGSKVMVPVEFSAQHEQGSGVMTPVESSNKGAQGAAILADERSLNGNSQKSTLPDQKQAPSVGLESHNAAGRSGPIPSPAGPTSTSSLSKMESVPNADSRGSLDAHPEQHHQVAAKTVAQESELTKVIQTLDRKINAPIHYSSRFDNEPSGDSRQSQSVTTNKEMGAQGTHASSPAQEPNKLFEELTREHFSLGRRGGENRENFDRFQDPLAVLRDVTFRQEITRAQVDTRPTPWASVIERVSGEIVSQLRQNRHEALIRLEPPELGHLKIELVVEGDKIHARISAEAMEARSLIQNHLPELRQALQAHKLELLEVRIDSGAWNGARGDLPQGQQQGASGRETWGEGFSGSTGSTSDVDEAPRVQAQQLAQGRVSIRA